MLQTFFVKLKAIMRDEVLRKKILFIFFALLFFRLLAAIPVPGADPARLEAFLAQNQFLGLFNIFSGGGLSNLSIVMVGVGAYITASIIMQLMTVIFPKLKELYHEQGEQGRKKFAQYSRMLAVPFALIQSVGLLALLQQNNVLPDLTMFDIAVSAVVAAGGAMLLMWLGELVSEFGIGNGISIIIFAGIVASLPSIVAQQIFTFDPSQIPMFLAFIAAAVLIIAGVTVMTEAERPIPITYAKRVRGMRTTGGISTYLPLRVNQAGVMPIIFALSILLFPQLIAGFFVNSQSATLAGAAEWILRIFQNGWFYSIFYFALVFFFTYFYTSITFEPDTIAKNLQKNGAFIPGVRPGEHTSEYIGTIVSRITLIGAIFLGAVAVLPLAMQAITDDPTLAIGGTAILIVVSVVLDLMKKVDAQVAMREY